jgi:hypothetical protein
LMRNSIVSGKPDLISCEKSLLTPLQVFLRALDYFQGILFLTTNRVGHFDEAFMSRIHLSLGYEKLDDSARKKIWDNLFRKLSDDCRRGAPQMTYEYDAKQYVKTKEVQSLEWNGREIRGLRLEAEKERRPARDDRRPFATSGVDVICVQKLYESNKRRNGRLNVGVQTR